jgi:cytochrome bd-type quinol oxidase subunit 1
MNSKMNYCLVRNEFGDIAMTSLRVAALLSFFNGVGFLVLGVFHPDQRVNHVGSLLGFLFLYFAFMLWVFFKQQKELTP